MGFHGFSLTVPVMMASWVVFSEYNRDCGNNGAAHRRRIALAMQKKRQEHEYGIMQMVKTIVK